MNTRFSMVVVGVEPRRAEALAAAAERDLRAHERLMSRFDPQSPVSALNRAAAARPVQPPDELWQILVLCRDYWRRTGGAFDVTLRPLAHLWRQRLRQGGEPAPEAIARARRRTGFERLLFDDAARTVRFQHPGVEIDLGGFGKGYALESLAASLRAQGIERAFLSFGESSITVLGAHPHGPAWPVGIASLFNPGQTVHTFQLCNASLSSSGTTPLNRLAGAGDSVQPPILGQAPVFGQTVDPHSGRPIVGYRTLSVVSSSAVEAEVLSTALLLTPPADRAALLAGFSAASAVEIVYHGQSGEFVPHIVWRNGF